MMSFYDLRKIRKLLMEGFTAEELEHFCRDTPDFKPVYYQLPQRASSAEIIVRLIEYAERSALLEELLDWAKVHNPAEYDKHQPYYEELTEQYRSHDKEPLPNKLESPPTPNEKPWWKFW
jgi:hypothetical protein